MVGKGRSLVSERGMVALVVASATLLGLALQWWSPFGMRDEAYQYLLCREWSEGSNLFTAFRLHYLQGSFAVGGVFMAVLGDGIWVIRLFNAVLGGLAAMAVWLAVRPAGGIRVAWLAALALPALGLGGLGPPALAAAAWAWGNALAATPRWRLLLGLGMLAGVLAGWREDAAVAVAFAAGVAALRTRPWVGVAWIPVGTAVGLLPWVGLAGMRGELGLWLGHTYHRYLLLITRLGGPGHGDQGWHWPRSLTSPQDVVTALFPLLAAIPPLLYGVVLMWQGSRWSSREDWSPRLVGVTVTALPWLAYYLLERRDIWHFRGHLPLLLVVIGVGAGALGGRWPRRAGMLLGTIAGLGAGLVLVQKYLTNPVPYPTSEAARIGLRVADEVPPWAGLERRAGETLIVFPWGVGWNVAEGLPPGSSVLAGYAYHLAETGALSTLIEDLGVPSNRWLIMDSWVERQNDAPYFGPVLAAAEAGYQPVASWRGWELWERSSADGNEQEILPAGAHHPGRGGEHEVGDQTSQQEPEGGDNGYRGGQPDPGMGGEEHSTTRCACRDEGEKMHYLGEAVGLSAPGGAGQINGLGEDRRHDGSDRRHQQVGGDGGEPERQRETRGDAVQAPGQEGGGRDHGSGQQGGEGEGSAADHVDLWNGTHCQAGKTPPEDRQLIAGQGREPADCHKEDEYGHREVGQGGERGAAGAGEHHGDNDGHQGRAEQGDPATDGSHDEPAGQSRDGGDGGETVR